MADEHLLAFRLALNRRRSAGPLQGAAGVFLATGHGMLGVTLAPATAALLAPLVLEDRAAPELAPFDPARRL